MFRISASCPHYTSWYWQVSGTGHFLPLSLASTTVCWCNRLSPHTNNSTRRLSSRPLQPGRMASNCFVSSCGWQNVFFWDVFVGYPGECVQYKSTTTVTFVGKWWRITKWKQSDHLWLWLPAGWPGLPLMKLFSYTDPWTTHLQLQAEQCTIGCGDRCLFFGRLKGRWKCAS